MWTRQFSFSFFLLLMLPAVMSAAPFAQWRQPSGSDPSIKMRMEAIMNAAQGNYVLRLTQKFATVNTPEYIEFHMTEPGAYGNFTALVRFFDMTVNAIPLRLIDLNKEDLTAQNGQCSMKLDFDGTIFRLDWYMNDASPLLFGKLTHISGEIRSCRIQIDAAPNGLLLDEKGKLISNTAEYQRRAQTPLRSLETQAELYPLNLNEDWVVLSDTLKGKGKRTKAGPCLVAWTPQSLKKATLHLQNSWQSSLFFDLKQDFKTFHFALWQTASPAYSIEKAVGIAKEFQKIAEK